MKEKLSSNNIILPKSDPKFNIPFTEDDNKELSK